MKKLLLLTILLLLFVGFSVDRTEPELLQVTEIEAQRCEMMTDSSYCD